MGPLTVRGVAALLATAGLLTASLALAAPPFAYLALLFAALLVLGVASQYLGRARGEVTRTVSTDLIRVGESSEVWLRVRLRGRRFRYAQWRDALPPAVSGTAAGSLLRGAAAPGERGVIMLSYTLHGIRRGVHELGPLTLTSTDPFGLVVRRQTVGAVREITVVPSLVALPRLRAARAASEGRSSLRTHQLGQGADNLSPRRYVPGDSRRRIHWRATAHRGALMVRQEEEEASPDAAIVLDLRAAAWASRATPEGDAAFEQAVSLCASAAAQFVALGYTVAVTDSHGTALAALSGHEDDVDELLVTLAGVTPGAGETVTLPRTTGPLLVCTGRMGESDALRAAPHSGLPIVVAAQFLPGAREAFAQSGWATQTLDEVVPDD